MHERLQRCIFVGVSREDDIPIWLELMEQPRKSSIFHKDEIKLSREPSSKEMTWHAALEYEKFAGKSPYDFKSGTPIPDSIKRAQRRYCAEIIDNQGNLPSKSALPASVDWIEVFEAGIREMTPAQIKTAHNELVKRHREHRMPPAQVISEAHRVAIMWDGGKSPYLTDPYIKWLWLNDGIIANKKEEQPAGDEDQERIMDGAALVADEGHEEILDEEQLAEKEHQGGIEEVVVDKNLKRSRESFDDEEAMELPLPDVKRLRATLNKQLEDARVVVEGIRRMNQIYMEL